MQDKDTQMHHSKVYFVSGIDTGVGTGVTAAHDILPAGKTAVQQIARVTVLRQDAILGSQYLGDIAADDGRTSDPGDQRIAPDR